MRHQLSSLIFIRKLNCALKSDTLLRRFNDYCINSSPAPPSLLIQFTSISSSFSLMTLKFNFYPSTVFFIRRIVKNRSLAWDVKMERKGIGVEEMARDGYQKMIFRVRVWKRVWNKLVGGLLRRVPCSSAAKPFHRNVHSTGCCSSCRCDRHRRQTSSSSKYDTLHPVRSRLSYASPNEL